MDELIMSTDIPPPKRYFLRSDRQGRKTKEDTEYMMYLQECLSKGRDVTQPVNKKFQKFEHRKLSLGDAAIDNVCLVAEAGFYFDRLKKVICCFHCGCEHDRDVDPWHDHAKRSPLCAYIRAVMSPLDVVRTTQTTEEKVCIVCWENQRDVVFYPCGHIVCCAKCGDGVKSCYVCRDSVRDVIAFYFS